MESEGIQISTGGTVDRYTIIELVNFEYSPQEICPYLFMHKHQSFLIFSTENNVLKLPYYVIVQHFFITFQLLSSFLCNVSVGKLVIVALKYNKKCFFNMVP
jgi:hypothetical protein